MCENKDADQQRGSRVADQCLCFRYTGNKFPLFPTSDISSLYVSSLAKQSDLCRTDIVENPQEIFYSGATYIMDTLYHTEQPKTLLGVLFNFFDPAG